ncbi:MAG: ribosome silencing factor [Bacteroidia bacterium]|nr:ribosome silencing factor [Bacteroidia bacterium]
MNKTPKKSTVSRKKTTDPGEALIKAIIQGIQEKKGHDIVMIDLRKSGNSITDYFIICHGTSDTQVEAIARSVEETVLKKTKEYPHHVEGNDNAHWIIIDYFNAVVHIFVEEKRNFYGLEKLWADAPNLKVAYA